MGPEDSTKLAKNIVRRHSTGPNLSIASSPVPLEDRNDRSRTNRGIDWYEKGSLVASQNLLLGLSSNPREILRTYSPTRSMLRRWISVPRIFERIDQSPDRRMGSRLGPEIS